MSYNCHSTVYINGYYFKYPRCCGGGGSGECNCPEAYTKPTLTVTGGGTFDIGQNFSNLIKITVKQGTDPVTKVSVGSQLYNLTGSVLTVDYTGIDNTKVGAQSVTVSINDGTSVVSKTVSWTFRVPVYIGYCNVSDYTTFTQANLPAFSKTKYTYAGEYNLTPTGCTVTAETIDDRGNPITVIGQVFWIISPTTMAKPRVKVSGFDMTDTFGNAGVKTISINGVNVQYNCWTTFQTDHPTLPEITICGNQVNYEIQ